MSSIILASKSPRRQELIRFITDDFEVISSDEPTALPKGISLDEVPVFRAAYKAGAVAQYRPEKTVIGADTAVILGGELMGKPRDEEDAIRMLRALSGKTHTVITGCCIIAGMHWRTFSQTTRVEFYRLSDREIMEYVASGEPMDKAGAYGIQGQGALFVKGIAGDYYNVMGLPVAELYRELGRMRISARTIA